MTGRSASAPRSDVFKDSDGIKNSVGGVVVTDLVNIEFAEFRYVETVFEIAHQD